MRQWNRDSLAVEKKSDTLAIEEKSDSLALEEKSASSKRWTPLLQQLFSRQTVQLLKPQQHFKERSWCYITSRRTGVLLAEGSLPCWPSSTKRLLSLGWRSSLSRLTRMKTQCSPT